MHTCPMMTDSVALNRRWSHWVVKPGALARPMGIITHNRGYAPRLRCSMLFSSQSIEKRGIPEGMLSREDVNDSESIAPVVTRRISEIILSHEDETSSECGNGCAISESVLSSSVPDGVVPRGRSVPEGVLSREEDSDSENHVAVTTTRNIPEGLLSREDNTPSSVGSVTTGFLRTVPEGILSHEDDSNSEPQSHSSTPSVPEGLLSREEDISDSVRISPRATRPIPEGLLSRESEDDDSTKHFTDAASAIHSSTPRIVLEGVLSRDDGAGVAPPGGNVAPPARFFPKKPSSTTSSTSTASSLTQFNWFKQWYAVAALDALDPTRPHAFSLLGQELVLWRDGSGKWQAFKDACPHRLAPLSEGRIEKDGTLMCAYHGWRFDGQGTCTTIPYCKPDDSGLRSPRSCAVSYPSLELGGVLWVWGEGGREAAAEAATKQPPLAPEVQSDGSPSPGVCLMGWSHRDLPYGHPFFVENVVDPAHVPVSHHNIAGNRYNDPKPFQLQLTRPVTVDGGFKVYNPDPYLPDLESSCTEFVPPGYVRIEQANKNGSRTLLALYSTPLKPGWCRLVGQQMTVEAPTGGGRARSAVGLVGAAMPKWLGHALGSVFMIQDMVFLHLQERQVARQQREQVQETVQEAHGSEAGAASQSRIPLPNYYLPGGTDRGVLAWRTWLAEYGGGDVSYAPGTPPLLSTTMDRSDLFDTWNCHTRHCSICMTALKRLRMVRTLAGVVGLAAAVLGFGAIVTRAAAANATSSAAATAAAVSSSSSSAVAAASIGGVWAVVKSAGWLVGSLEGAALVVVAGLSVGAMLLTSKIDELMHRYEYSHADNH